MRRHGLFITFEGCEGSGKSTQARLLRNYLRGRGRKALLIREPGGTRISERIRNILLDRNTLNMSDVCETMLYMASRAQLVSELIMPALQRGDIVICDRFLDSTIVYQGRGLGVNARFIKETGAVATGGLKPDITFFLDVGVKTGLMRNRKAKAFADRIESRSIAFHKKVRQGYLALAKAFPKRITTIRVDSKDKDQTQSLIRKVVSGVIK